MSVTSPCYCTREAVMTALDVHPAQREISLIDSAIQGATGDVYGIIHRRFLPHDTTKYFDWPNEQLAYPWRIWFDQHDLVSATAVTSVGVSIPLANVFFEPVNKQPDEPYTRMELNRATSSVFGGGTTPQRVVGVTGTWSYNAKTAPAGALAAPVSDTTGTTVTVTDSSQLGVGDLLVIDSERMVVADRAMASTGVTFTGLSAIAADNLIAVPDVTAFGLGEVLMADAERLYVTDKTATSLVVKRAWQGTALAEHTSGTIYAARSLAVLRGANGTTAATHASAAAVSRYVVPSLITELAIALAENSLLQKTSGYARSIGAGDNLRPAPGMGLADVTAHACARYGRKARTRVI